MDNDKLANLVRPYFDAEEIEIHENDYLVKVVGLVKERCQLLPDFITQASFYFQIPKHIDIASIAPKWEEKKKCFFEELVAIYSNTMAPGIASASAADLEIEFKELASKHGLKPGELMLPFRIMLVGGKFGPGVFEIVETIQLKDTIARIQHCLHLLS
jgi:glutamyl-tRNA synthetase